MTVIQIRWGFVTYTISYSMNCLEEFLFAPGSDLKKRKHTRAGEGVAMKRCSGIYVLTSVADGGAPFEDMKDLLSLSKLPSHNRSVCGDTNPDFRSQVEDKFKSNGGDVELSLLRSIIANVQADVLQLKEVNKSLKEEFYKDVKVVKDEIKSIKTELSSAIKSNSKNSNSIVEIRQAVDRLNNEKSIFICKNKCRHT